MADTLFLALFPVVFVVILGWIAARSGYVKRDQAQAFGAFVMRFALPFALLAGILKMSPAQIPTVGYTLCLLAGFVGTYLMAFLIGRSLFRNDLASSALQGLCCAFPSMAFSGVPILTTVVGSRGLIPVIMGNLVTSFVLIPATLVLIEISRQAQSGEGEPPLTLLRKSIIHSAKEPIVWLPLLGGALMLFGVHLPLAVTSAVTLIGDASAGTGLFVVGLMLYGTRMELSKELVTNAAMKNIAQPLLIALIVPLFGVAAISHARELILTGAIPAATTCSIMAVRYQKYVAEATSAVVASTLLALVTIAAVVLMIR